MVGYRPFAMVVPILSRELVNKQERIKSAKDGLDAIEGLLSAAESGGEVADPDDLYRFKWHGLYEQNAKDGHFMLRVKVVQGILTAEQAETLAWIAAQHGCGMLDWTTRRCVQIRWITLPEVPEILRRLEAVGLTTKGACGDITRNVIGCTVAGIAHDDLVDGFAAARALHEHFLGNRAYSNLPRKYKISVTGCSMTARGARSTPSPSPAQSTTTARLGSIRASAAVCPQHRASHAGLTCSSPRGNSRCRRCGHRDLPRRRGESPTSASKASSDASTAKWSKRWTSASAAGSAPTPRFGEPVAVKVPHWKLDATLRRIFALCDHRHGGGETFRDFAGRTGPAWWQTQLATQPITASTPGRLNP
jgi:hypothetical protein